ncbi:MAG: hypothetical protein HY433_01475 [Candidatus Liptonbacteria bacterium]|nr:hypothetical protein [Candidatus Liptonbacteria bacterium]
MKPILTILLVGSFIGVAVFGFAGMHNGMEAHDGDCIAATAQGAGCSKQASPVDYAAFHLNAFKIFSSAAFSENFLSVLLPALAALLLIGLGFFRQFLFMPPQPILSRHKFRNTFSFPQKREFIRWLALHENSPATF